MARSGTAITVVVLLAIAEIGSSLQCFRCSSISDSSCKVNVKPKYRTKTEKCQLPKVVTPTTYLRAQLHHYCRKIVEKDGTVTRACFVNNKKDNGCSALKKKFRDIKYCGSCQKDYCNGTISVTSSLHLAALTLVAVYLYNKL